MYTYIHIIYYMLYMNTHIYIYIYTHVYMYMRRRPWEPEIILKFEI